MCVVSLHQPQGQWRRNQILKHKFNGTEGKGD